MERAFDRYLTHYPEDYFERSEKTSFDAEQVTHTCEVCGVVAPIPVLVGDTERIGYLRKNCKCEREARERESLRKSMEEYREKERERVAARTYNWLGIDQPKLSLMTFERFNPDSQPEVHHAAILAAYDYARGYASMCLATVVGQPNVLFAGNYGTGKTHLACAILNVLRAQGIRCLFTTAQDLFNSLYAAPFDEKPTILKQASDTPLLVIDDLDKLHVAQSTDGAFQKRTLFDILDRRYKGQRPTIITTNEQNDLGQWLDGATISRLFSNLQPVLMNGADYRRQAKPKTA